LKRWWGAKLAAGLDVRWAKLISFWGLAPCRRFVGLRPDPVRCSIPGPLRPFQNPGSATDQDPTQLHIPAVSSGRVGVGYSPSRKTVARLLFLVG